MMTSRRNIIEMVSFVGTFVVTSLVVQNRAEPSLQQERRDSLTRDVEPDQNRDDTPQTSHDASKNAVANGRTLDDEFYLLLSEMGGIADIQRAIDAARAANRIDEVGALSADQRRIRGKTRNRLLEFALRNPGTSAAEQALIVLANGTLQDPEFEKAWQTLARDHFRTDRIRMLLGTRYLGRWTSKGVEELYRNAMSRNPYGDIRGNACYLLAEFLRRQAAGVRLLRLSRAARGDRGLKPLPDDNRNLDRILTRDPKALEEEAITLLERVTVEYNEIESYTTSYGNGNPRRLGEAARTSLDELRRLSVGNVAPEIDGNDLDGKPMKLSGFRGQVVVLFIDAKQNDRGREVVFPDGRVTRKPVLPAQLPMLARTFTGKPVAFLGVLSGFDRETFRRAAIDRKLPARFWWGTDEAGQPGSSLINWLAGDVEKLYVIDSTGMISYTDANYAGSLELAVEAVLKEQKK